VGECTELPHLRLLEGIPFREGLRRRLEQLWNHERLGAPRTEGEYRYFWKNDGLQNQAVIFREKPGGEPEVFLDPNGFSSDGTTSLAGIGFSPDGSLVAYQVSEAGADWRTVRVISTDSPDTVLETLTDVKFSDISWRGNQGFYYSSYPSPETGSLRSGVTERHRLMFHRLGTPQSQDIQVFGGDDTPRRYIGGGVTEDQRWLVISASVSTTGNELYVQDLSVPGSPVIPVVTGFEKEYRVVHSEGNTLFVETNRNAPNNRLVSVDMSAPAEENWVDVIPERPEVLQVTAGGGFFFACYLKDALSVVEQVSTDGSVIREIALPGPGTAWGFSAKRWEKTVFYSFTSYTHPVQVHSLDTKSGESRLYWSPSVDFKSEDFVSTQVFYQSRDGTSIPMILTHCRGLSMNGDNPTLLYGYGGFNNSLTPVFDVSKVVWLENGGVFAVANIRGGGEYGEAWHLAGTKTLKQNVFDDFIAGAEYLIGQGCTSSERLAVSGGSNGGLLVGAVMTQRPELFAVALPAVGVLDMLRYHKFTAGAGWAYDYGTAEDSEEMFRCLLAYSPLHNLRDGTAYPATLVTTSDHDDRVVPAHSFKFAARLQEAQAGHRPVLIRVEVKAGHGMGKPLSKIIAGEADRLAFALYNMGVSVSY